MKYIVIGILGIWFAFVTVMQSFHGWELFVEKNHHPVEVSFIVAIAILPIALGYIVLFIGLMNRSIPILKTITFTLATGVAVACSLIIARIYMRNSGPLLLQTYIHIDQFLRQKYDITIAWMDYGNFLLLVATQIWWLLTAAILLCSFTFSDKKHVQ